VTLCVSVIAYAFANHNISAQVAESEYKRKNKYLVTSKYTALKQLFYINYLQNITYIKGNML
jgi:hypothetical protein